MFRRLITLAALSAFSALGACTMPGPPPLQPAPMAFHSPLSPSAAAQTAAQTLLADNFELVTSDAAGGIVIARRRRALNQVAGLVTCRWPETAPGAAGVQTELTINVVARASATGSDVTLTSAAKSAHTNFNQALSSPDASTTDCATSGREEARVSAAIKGT